MSTTTPMAPAARVRGGLTVGRWLALAGGVLVAVTGWLDWTSRTTVGPDESAFKFPAKFVLDYQSLREGLSLGVVVLVLGLLIALAAFAPGAAGPVLGVLLGIAAGLLAFLFVYQVHVLLDENDVAGVTLTDALGIGPYLAAVGGALAVLGGLLAFVIRR